MIILGHFGSKATPYEAVLMLAAFVACKLFRRSYFLKNEILKHSSSKNKSTG